MGWRVEQQDLLFIFLLNVVVRDSNLSSNVAAAQTTTSRSNELVYILS